MDYVPSTQRGLWRHLNFRRKHQGCKVNVTQTTGIYQAEKQLSWGALLQDPQSPGYESEQWRKQTFSWRAVKLEDLGTNGMTVD